MRRERLRDTDFYMITDAALTRRGTEDDVRRAVEAGCRIVQYRVKDLDTRSMVEEARALRGVCMDRALFLVNDRVDVALAVDADGVHIGQDDMPFHIARRLLGPERIIGLTVHDVPEALEAERLGADYLGLSPIFPTGTKADAGAACGTAMIERVRAASSLPIVAVGGITLDNVGDVIRAGAESASAISAVLCAEDAGAETGRFIAAIRAGEGNFYNE